MGLFDKKFCDVCNKKTGLFSSRKLEDGNLCSDCAKKLSPFFDDRRHSTIEQIKEQLDYREQNKLALKSFVPSLNFGKGDCKVLVDTNAKAFVITDRKDWRTANPDIIKISQVTGCVPDIREDSTELFYKDSEGKSRSYSPPRFEYKYEFAVTVSVSSPWFDDIEVILTDPQSRPESIHDERYQICETEMNRLCACLTGKSQSEQPTAEPGSAPAPAPAPAPAFSQTEQKFLTIRCDKCGWQLLPGQPLVKFCPECGDPITADDIG